MIASYVCFRVRTERISLVLDAIAPWTRGERFGTLDRGHTANANSRYMKSASVTLRHFGHIAREQRWNAVFSALHRT